MVILATRRLINNTKKQHRGRLKLIRSDQDKDDMDKSCYRPVSVLVIFDTVFEKCLYQQLYQWFEKLLVPNQSAFRKHHSCDMSLLNLIENWKCNLDAKQYVGVVALDLSKAFDSLPHELLLAKLQAYGISKPSIQLIRNFLTKR